MVNRKETGLILQVLKYSMSKARKHEKLIIIGDFNTATSLAFKKCCYHGTNVIPDDDYYMI